MQPQPDTHVPLPRSVKELCAYYQVSPKTLHRWCREAGVHDQLRGAALTPAAVRLIIQALGPM